VTEISSRSTKTGDAMKPPRWLPACLWAAIAICIILAGVWWIVCPELTSRRFTDSLTSGEFENANQLFTNGRWSFGNDAAWIELERAGTDPSRDLGWYVGRSRPVRIEITREPVNSTDLIRGVRRLRLDRVGNFSLPKDQIWFVVHQSEVCCELPK
jgi:hypothetical protein